MATIHRLFIEADLLQRKLEAMLIWSYRESGDSDETKNIKKVLNRAEYRKARRMEAVRLDTISRATKGHDGFKRMMESYTRRQI